jgi:putative hydrolase of the HAD superfamily
MPPPSLAPSQIEAILFDMNGTLRQRIPDDHWQKRAKTQLFSMLGNPSAPDAYLEDLTRRYKVYTCWANEHQLSLPEAEVWKRWITPELSPELIEPRAVELMISLRNCAGRPCLRPETADVISALHGRGYRLGVISNTSSTADLPRFIIAAGLEDYLEVIILSSVNGARKPDPAIFLTAASELNLPAARCAYIGNKPAFDVAGPRRAGFGLAVILSPDGLYPEASLNPELVPDGVVSSLGELLRLFPPLHR